MSHTVRRQTFSVAKKRPAKSSKWLWRFVFLMCPCLLGAAAMVWHYGIAVPQAERDKGTLVARWRDLQNALAYDEGAVKMHEGFIRDCQGRLDEAMRKKDDWDFKSRSESLADELKDRNQQLAWAVEERDKTLGKIRETEDLCRSRFGVSIQELDQRIPRE